MVASRRPVLDAFLAEHPEVAIDLNLTDGSLDLISQGQDFAVRWRELKDCAPLPDKVAHANLKNSLSALAKAGVVTVERQSDL